MTDYDRTEIPAGYDRGRDHGPEMLALWMDAVSAHVDQTSQRILDLGCGTGRFSDSLAVRFGAMVVGIDPSFKMLERAARKPHVGRVHYQLGRAEALPLRAGSIDIVFMSMSLHHFADTGLAASECRRVLCGGGSVMIRTGTREQISSYPYNPIIPETHPILERVLPTSMAVRGIFEAAGFHLIAADLVSQTIAPNWSAYADKLAANADSVLARLSPEELSAGIARVRAHALANAVPVVEPIDFFVFHAPS
jgi:ubiquinone/menaquinone biosynthesis C-methylase UbiE